MKKFIVSLVLTSAVALCQVVNPPAIQPAGNAQPVIENTYVALAQTATIAATKLQCIAPSQPAIATSPTLGIQPVAPLTQSAVCPAGIYRVTTFLQNTSGTNGGGTATPALTFHTSSTAQSVDPASALTESTGNYVQSTYVLRSDGSTDITYAVTQGSSGSFDLRVVLERLQ